TVSTGSNLSIGVVRPYNAQVRAIQEKVGKTCRVYCVVAKEYVNYQSVEIERDSPASSSSELGSGSFSSS
ncbi:hypothetical protein ACJX0J_032562, partial [Zea mays]